MMLIGTHGAPWSTGHVVTAGSTPKFSRFLFKYIATHPVVLSLAHSWSQIDTYFFSGSLAAVFRAQGL